MDGSRYIPDFRLEIGWRAGAGGIARLGLAA